ncbi:fibulin-1-like [Palaemon carinicauda]|uniref:fibulin-1-like n=1 Tax=Palaemon carinicauda TaxID=392227 RepID=UPI0035B698F9
MEASEDPCGPGGPCINIIGTYLCNCTNGFEDIGGFCQDIDECPYVVCNGSAICNNIEGSYTCECQEGFIDVGGNCEDIDECASNPCNASQDCHNIPGSFECGCKALTCPSKCFENANYVDGVGCVMAIRGSMNFPDAENRCNLEHKEILSIKSNDVLNQVVDIFGSELSGVFLWLEVDDSIYPSSKCVAMVIRSGDPVYFDISCTSSKLPQALCVTQSIW